MNFNSLEEEIEYFKSKKRFSCNNFSENLINHLEVKYPNISLVEQFFLLIHNLNTVPVCTYNDCNKSVDFISFQKGYKKGCCRTHSQKISFLEKYGVENPSQLEEVIIKRKETTFERFGVEYASQSYEIKEKVKQNCLYKHGVLHHTQRKDVLKKREQNNIKKYGIKHTAQLETTKEKIKKTNLERYGVSNVSKSKVVKEKIKKTNLERYGVENYYQSDDFKNKSKQTSLKKYGTESPNQCEIIKEKQEKAMLRKYGFKCNFSKENRSVIEKTMFEKYGSINPMNVPEIKSKLFETNLNKYGCISPLGNEIVRKKGEKTNLKQYGFRNASQSEEIKEKRRNIIKEKYGKINVGQLNLINFEKWNDKEFIKFNFFNEKNNFNYIKFMNFFNCCQSVAHNKIKDLGIEYNYITNCSLIELEIYDFINDNSKIKSDRKILNGKEIDIYIPDKRLGIELDGVYWHSAERIEDRNYHLNKTIECENQNIKLLHIFDTEWLEKREIVMSMINANMGKYNKIFYCNYYISNISKLESNNFLNENNIFGEDDSNIRLGLFFENELISLVTFKEINNSSYELLRICNKIGYNVINGIDKLWSFFVNEYSPNNVITYVNRRYDNESICKNFGFNLINETDPELINVNGFDIWDCGKLIFEWTRKEI